MGPSDNFQVIDSNCFLGNWPTRRLRTTSAKGLAGLAEENGVDLCLVSPLDAIFHKDHISANERLADDLRKFEARLIPLPIANPSSPMGNTFQGKALRIVPSYHRYSLTNRRCEHLLEEARSRNMTIFISFRMRDERLTHPLLNLKRTRTSDLTSTLSKLPDLRVVINNAKASEIENLLPNTPNNTLVGCGWSFPIGFIERMVDLHGDERLVFGSNAPLHYYQSSLLQIRKADISERSKKRILGDNLREML